MRPDVREDERWTPKLGDRVWMNYPDHPAPLGRVVGFVPEGQHRAGQPVIHEEMGKRKPFGKGWDEPALIVIAPMFVLPFPYGGPEWQEANAAGLVG